MQFRVLFFLITTLFTSTVLYAAGFQLNENSPRLQGEAMAGSGASPDDITSIFDNPANLGFVSGNQLYLGGSLILPHLSVNNAQASHGSFPYPDMLVPVTGSAQQANISNPAAVPQFYGNWNVDSHWTAGLSLTAPWGSNVHYDGDSVLRYAAQQTSLKAYNILPELAYHQSTVWSVAAGLQLQFLNAEFSNFDGTAQVITPTLSPTNYPSDIALSGFGVGYTLGAVYHPFEKTYLGASYRSQINYHLTGSGEQYTVPGGLTPQPYFPTPVPLPVNAETSASASFTTPAVLNLGLTQYVTPQWALRATAQLTFWNVLQSLNVNMPSAFATNMNVPLDWRNVWLFSLGTDYHLLKNWVLRAGFAYDETPTQAETMNARLPDSNRFWLTAGTTYAFNDHFLIDFAYEHIFMQNNIVDNSQYIGSNGGPINPLELNQVFANYSGSADIVALGVNYKF